MSHDMPQTATAPPPSCREATAILHAAVAIVIQPLLRLWEEDPHGFSTRPCPTCRTISALAQRAFGCVAQAARARVESERARHVDPEQ